MFLYNFSMNIDQIITKIGSQSELARLLGVSRGAVWIWKRDGLPKSRIWQLKLLRPEWFEVIK
jgi:DNA invertase Pin-like site-specific DNA recombinase